MIDRLDHNWLWGCRLYGLYSWDQNEQQVTHVEWLLASYCWTFVEDLLKALNSGSQAGAPTQDNS